jgi:spermidine/putrescine transport system substrate-binding protein
MGVGLFLDATGKVKSNRMMDVYKSEDDAKRVWDAVAAYIIENKKSVGAFWNNATEATNAFTAGGCAIGQTWDSTGIKLGWDVDKKWKYRMPKEGGITWMDSVALPAGAENVEQAYAFINELFTGELAGIHVKNTGYNSAATKAADFAGDQYAKTFNEIYSADALGNLWWWQADTPWFSATRQIYVDKITNA